MIPFKILNRIVEIQKAKEKSKVLTSMFNRSYIKLARKRLTEWIKSEEYDNLSEEEKNFLKEKIKDL